MRRLRAGLTTLPDPKQTYLMPDAWRLVSLRCIPRRREPL